MFRNLFVGRCLSRDDGEDATEQEHVETSFQARRPPGGAACGTARKDGEGKAFRDDSVMIRTRLMVLAALVGLTAAFAVTAADSLADLSGKALWEQAKIRFFPLPTVVPNPENELIPAKVELGKVLYFDTRLSKEGNVSCDSCHILAEFGVDNLPTSPGDDGEFGTRNSPTVLNAALHLAQFWDGRAKDVEEQAGMPILNPIEMAIPSEEFLVERLSGVPEYQRLFAEAFPDDDPALTYANIARALGSKSSKFATPTGPRNASSGLCAS